MAKTTVATSAPRQEVKIPIGASAGIPDVYDVCEEETEVREVPAVTKAGSRLTIFPQAFGLRSPV